MLLRPSLFAVVALAVGCGATDPGPGGAAVQRPSASSSGSSAPGEKAARSDHRLELEEAERYVLGLVNRDRGEHGLRPVEWDEAAAKGGKVHSDDMAAHGFTAHVGTDGSVPEQRYTEAGGAGMVMENAGCVADGKSREIDPHALYLPEALEKIEHAFMNEVPPNDGHRRNILTAYHTAFGVGLTQDQGLDIPCMAQEFVDDYGRYDALPAQAKIGAKTKITGELRASAKVAGVGVARIDFPGPVRPDALNRSHSYSIPKPATMYFPKGFKTSIPLEVDGRAFAIEVPLSDGGRAGLYEVSVWAELPAVDHLVMVSLRTIAVR
jgi:uncharacterized protein YkwD